jgi:hypothetical protein
MNCGFIGNTVLSPCPVEPNEALGRSPSLHGAALPRRLSAAQVS